MKTRTLRLSALFTAAALTATETALRDKVAPPPGGTAAKVKAEGARMPEPLRSMLQQISSAGVSQALSATRENLSANVGGQVGQFCIAGVDVVGDNGHVVVLAKAHAQVAQQSRFAGTHRAADAHSQTGSVGHEANS